MYQLYTTERHNGQGCFQKKLSKKEKVDLVKEILGKDYNTSGEDFKILSNIIDGVGYFDDGYSLAEVVFSASTLLKSGSFLSVVASGTAIFSIVMFPIDSMIKVLNAYQTGHKFYSYRAITYTITAWAFNKPIPQQSQRILSNLRKGPYVRDNSIVKEYKAVWRKTSKLVIKKINSEFISDKTPENVVQAIFRALADNNEQKLYLLIMKGFEDKFSSIEKRIWKSRYKIKYPR